jgi:hypothetical protein
MPEPFAPQASPADTHRSAAAQYAPYQAASMSAANSRIDSSYLIWAEDFYADIERYKMYLRGVEIQRNPETGDKEIAKPGEPLLNEKGIFRLTGYLSILVSKNTYLSNLSERRAHEMAKENSIALTLELGQNAEAYGLKPDKLPAIMVQFDSVLELALRRAIDNKERDLLGGVVVESRVINDASARNGGFFDKIFKRGRN